MKRRVFLAIDLGASSGRVMAGAFNGHRLALEEVHRFPNGGCRLPDGWHWELVGLFAEIKKGLARARATYGDALVSAGADTWGVDYGLLDRDGRLLGLPYMYRDGRTQGIEPWLFARAPRERIYRTTGIQFMFFNTLLQLAAERKARTAALEKAERLLFTPDLIHYWLTGRATNEYTIASTSQMLDARRRDWARGLIRQIGFPSRIFGDLIQPGTTVGPLLPALRQELGIRKLKIVAPGSHDTASAVAAVPSRGKDHVYVSSGTWSLMGVERRDPLLTSAAYAANFTNEGGVCGTLRFLKNIGGLWLAQECRRRWNERGANLSFPDIEKAAAKEQAFVSIINPDAPEFAAPGDMPARIAQFCQRTKQPIPTSPGTFGRAIFQSLALRYSAVLEQLRQLTGPSFSTLHIVGGGSQNRLLSQLAADATNLPVVTGPAEATAIGNVLMQMINAREIKSLDEGRELVRRSFPVETYSPKGGAEWDEARARFARLAKT